MRGVAAIAVLLCHAATHVDLAFGTPTLRAVMRPGHNGVDLFFVLSGFLLLLIHHRDIGRPRSVTRYAWRRVRRIYPVYWLALACTIAVTLAGGHGWPAPGRVILSILLWPRTTPPLHPLAWTLQYEVLFYLFFALLLLHRILGLVTIALWLLAILTAQFVPLGGGLATNIFAIEFFFGMGTAHILRIRRPGPRLAAWVAAVGATAFLSAWALEAAGLLYGYGFTARLLYGLSAAALIGGAAGSEGLVRWPRALIGIGQASYAIYLFHLIGIGVAWQIGLRLGVALPPLIWFVLLTIAGALLGGMVHLAIERPLIAWMRRRG
ncbi:acyltransferase [Sphingomonas paucimobilis]|uniref:Acyltransferase n=2 Tax=Sphingomonas paucimobilis TaxID=13689 RepID=A0A411LI88_SPHPI|nr:MULTISPECIES: acyltransferase [Sphingomonas]MBQ1479540.1 acyltransferase [Sphingomonas sp.]MCM3678110.1 acyltransferase [Sphingomonas paucimobilis]MDG5972745.1 acyltransferase [Sphingomonas paucimobilis]NNG59277.1 acyltransferase [Sphingomonas paucimobilis]QBE92047.1 acyltransferase [Sphingomonas paucimobilis]